MLGIVDYSKVGGEPDCKEDTSLGVYEWSLEGIIEGIMLTCIKR